MNPSYSPESLVVKGERFVPYISAEEIAKAVNVIGRELDQDLGDTQTETPLLLVCVLKGATLFFADLVRSLKRPVYMEFVRASSYGEGMVSSGSLTFTALSGTEIEGRNVILVEDIIDTGKTVSALRRYFIDKKAASVKVAALLYKPDMDNGSKKPEYVGFEIPNHFVIGYGLDYAEEGRNLGGIYVLEEKEFSAISCE